MSEPDVFYDVEKVELTEQNKLIITRKSGEKISLENPLLFFKSVPFAKKENDSMVYYLNKGRCSIDKESNEVFCGD